MHRTRQISTKTLKINNKTLIGFKYNDVYSNKYLFKIINTSITIGGLVYFDKTDLKKSILDLI